MANPNPVPPPKEYRWKPGQSGNPAGYSRGRRLADALREAIDRDNLEESLIQTWLGKALGRPDMLGGREPDWPWFKELVDRLDGKAVGLESITAEVAKPHEIPAADPRFVDSGVNPTVAGAAIGVASEGSSPVQRGGDGQDVRDTNIPPCVGPGQSGPEAADLPGDAGGAHGIGARDV